jgi:hypothetical protein
MEGTRHFGHIQDPKRRKKGLLSVAQSRSVRGFQRDRRVDRILKTECIHNCKREILQYSHDRSINGRRSNIKELLENKSVRVEIIEVVSVLWQ